jgi:type I restriction enzyme R subunit
VDSDLHRLSIYLRFLIKKIEVESPQGVNITDKVLLQYYKLENKGKQTIKLDGVENDVGVTIKGESQNEVSEAEPDYLSSIIQRLNEKFGTNFSESEKLAVEQIMTSLKSNEDLKMKAQQNTYDDYKYAFEPAFLEGVINEFDKNQSFFGKILQDPSFKEKLMNLMMFETYQSHNMRI